MGQPFQHPSKLQTTKMRMFKRRLRVARLTAQGLSLRRVARRVDVSHETVRKDLQWWFRELNQEEAEQRLRKAEWEAWSEWCAEHGHRLLPADPAAVVDYLREFVPQRISVPRVRRIRAVIAESHRIARLPNPLNHESVRSVLRLLSGQTFRDFMALVRKNADGSG